MPQGMNSKLPLTTYYTTRLNEFLMKCLARVTYGTRFNINISSQAVKLKKSPASRAKCSHEGRSGVGLLRYYSA